MVITGYLLCFHYGNGTIFLEEYGEHLFSHIYCIKYTIMNKYYPGKPVNMNIQSRINIIQKKIWVITNKKGYR